MAGDAWDVVESTLRSVEQGDIDVEVDDALGKRLLVLIGENADDVSRERFEHIARRIMQVFGLSAAYVAKELGGVTAEPANAPRVRAPFDALVPDGWMREWLDWSMESEAETQFHFGSALAVVAAALGRKPLLDWQAKRTYANLYVMLVGPSGSKKSSAIDLALGTLRRAMVSLNVMPVEGTPQGLAEALRARSHDTGTADGLICCDEFTVLMSKDRNKEDLTKWLTAWYDSPDEWKRGLASRPDFELRSVCVSVLGGSTPEWLKGMPRDAIVGGFMPRFVLFDALDRRHFKADPKFDVAAGARLAEQAWQYVRDCPQHVSFTADARAWLRAWYEIDLRRQIEATMDEGVRKWLDRKQAAVMKMACVWQLLDGALGSTNAKIDVKWLAQARNVVDWGDESVTRVYARLVESDEGALAADVLRLLERTGGVVAHDQLVRVLRPRYGIRRIREALATLQAGGEIAPAGGALRATVWVRRSVG